MYERDKELYALQVDDWSLPGFCSGSAFYIGTLGQIEDYIAGIPERFEEMREELKNCLERFCAGERELEYPVAYGMRRFLTPVTLYGSKEEHYDNLAWESLNIWDCPYALSGKDMDIQHIWVSYANAGQTVYARYYKVSCRELFLEDRNILNWIGIWGLPGLIVLEEGNVHSALYLVGQGFGSEEELRADMEQFKLNPEDDLRSLMFAIVGDG